MADDVMSMTVLDHMREAARLMEGPDVPVDAYDTARADNVRSATAHLLFAQVLNQTGVGSVKAMEERQKQAIEELAKANNTNTTMPYCKTCGLAAEDKNPQTRPLIRRGAGFRPCPDSWHEGQ